MKAGTWDAHTENQARQRMMFSIVCLCLLCPAISRPLPTLAPLHSGDNAKRRILVLKTRDIPFFAPAVQGLTDGLKKRGYRNGGNTDIAVCALSGKVDADAKLVREQIARQPALIVTLGTDATRLVAEQKPDIPGLFCMVLDPVALGVAKTLDAPGGRFSGTTLLVPPGKQLEALLQTAPQAKRIAVCYTDADPTSLAFLTEARQEAKRLNVTIAALPVSSGHTARERLNELKDGDIPDALWIIPDPASTGGQALTDTLQYARARHLPVLGAAGATVKAGALLALSADIADIGDETADMAAHILDGTETPAAMRVRGPRRTLLTLSLVSAKALGITLPNAVLRLADEVIEKAQDEE